MWDQCPFLVLPGKYVGQSTCNNFTSALGAGQRVLSYSYYRPDPQSGKPSDTVERFLGLFQPLAESARRLFPGWRLRIYHNVTSEDTEELRYIQALHKGAYNRFFPCMEASPSRTFQCMEATYKRA